MRISIVSYVIRDVIMIKAGEMVLWVLGTAFLMQAGGLRLGCGPRYGGLDCEQCLDGLSMLLGHSRRFYMFEYDL